LVLWSQLSEEKTRTTVAAAALSLLDSLFIGVLSAAEHVNSIRPSILLQFYLFLSVLFDTVRARSLWLDGDNVMVSSLFAVSLVLRLIVLVLESIAKTSNVIARDKNHSPEETCGLFGLALFSWMNKLLISGYRKVLSLSDMYPLPVDLSSRALAIEFKKVWDGGTPYDDHESIIRHCD
jgi:hypothetical protein